MIGLNNDNIDDGDTSEMLSEGLNMQSNSQRGMMGDRDKDMNQYYE